ncbi:putative potassium transporter 12 isoform X2 [Cryptomeria japonica]|uniref:putative potassium transporter 12 isoform X2 n=1 Tax=Cryptomeria japonica TaxID=3369 RepID=UPI0025AD31A0|nr:putative potassium transporter 12 isoform X2 [Cryptomeria japonica]
MFTLCWRHPFCHNADLSMGHTLRLAFQTLGVVFGDVGTSPLYVFSGVFIEISEPTKDDVLGALSLILYSLVLIPLIKYAFIVLRANDNGEGGTFALYSLICRYAKVSLLPNQQPADAYISTFKLKLPTPELERALIIKECLEKYSILKTLLLILVLIGSSMLVVDGILTPAVSVMSAMRGLKEPVPDFSEDVVLMASIAFLVILFSIQRFGTSKVGVAFGPALFIWFLSLGAIGLYNILSYDKSVFRALNPLYIYYFFERNPSQAWLSLGGCMLCITGAEAMFADLGHFSVRSIQIAFTCLVFPCLLLAYMGQAAFLIKNPSRAGEAFYASVPAGAFWPVLVLATFAAMIASQSMISATFSCIKQSMALGCFPRLKIIHTSKRFMGQIYIPIVNWFLMTFCILVAVTFKSTSKIGNAYGIAEVGVMMVTTVLVAIIMVLIWQTNVFLALSFLVLFLAIELIYFIAVLIRVGDGSWFPLVFASVILLVMYIWNYGSVLKYQSEVQTKVSMDLMLELGSNLGTIRVPGIGLVYNELVHGVPAIFGHFITSLPAIHSTIIFVCIKYIPVPFVSQSQRFLFRRVCPKNYHMFRCIARYGYKDFHKEDHQAFEQLLIESIEKFIRREADELSLESGDDYNLESEDEAKDPRSAGASNGSIDSLEAPLMAGYRKSSQYFAHQESQQEASTSSGLPPSVMSTDDQSLEYELSIINRAKESGVVYLLGHGDIRARKDSWFFKKLVINYFYAFLRKNCRAGIATLSVPHTNLLQVGMTHMV